MPDTPASSMGGNDEGHHSSGGRNIIPPNGSHRGHDIFYAAVQMTRMPMVLTDPHQHDNPIVFCNQAFEELCGYPREEILGRNCRFLQGSETDPHVVARIRSALSRGEDVQEEMVNYRKDGEPFWNGLFISPVTDTDGRLVYHFASQINVTRRREAEAVMQQSQRIESLGSMASALAHELNNVGTVVRLNLERAQDEADPERREALLKRALWGVDKSSRLTEQILSFSHRQYHDNRVTDLKEMLAGFDAILDQAGGSKVKVRVLLPAEPLHATLDTGQLQLALLNLVRNAADAMPTGGDVAVSLAADEDPRCVQIAVADKGTGMSEDTVRRATEPFFTTKRQGKGTGLGLSMVIGFVQQAGGRLAIDSQEGRGTTIRLIFPSSEQAEPGILGG